MYKRLAASVAVAGFAVLGLGGVASAGEPGLPFGDCSEAYAAGRSNIPSTDPAYQESLDRDNDGVGCDKPPPGFVTKAAAAPTTEAPSTDTAESTTEAASTTEAEPSTTSAGVLTGKKSPAEPKTSKEMASASLASTGPHDNGLLVAGGLGMLALGSGTLVLARKRPTGNHREV